MLFNSFAAKPLKKPISQYQAGFIDLIIIDLFYYLPNFLKTSAHISLEREYSSLNILRWIFYYKSYQVTSLESLDTTPLKPDTYWTTWVVDAVNGNNALSHRWQRKC